MQVKECGSEEGLWIPTELDHIKRLTHHPPQLHSPTMHCSQHCTIFLTFNHSVTVS